MTTTRERAADTVQNNDPRRRFGNIGLNPGRHIVNTVGAQGRDGRHLQHPVPESIARVPLRARERILNRAPYATGDLGPERGTHTARADRAVVTNEVMPEGGRRQPGDLDVEHRDELVVDVLAERADRDGRRAPEVPLELDLEMRRVFGIEPV